ncbi:hypothetical protein V498_08125, partial [Pseudogymnoascus sp. VKM F-4517 (FW-2822)]
MSTSLMKRKSEDDEEYVQDTKCEALSYVSKKAKITDGDSDQVVVTTLADLFDVKKAVSKDNSAQLIGSMTEEAPQHLTDKRYSSRFGAVGASDCARTTTSPSVSETQKSKHSSRTAISIADVSACMLEILTGDAVCGANENESHEEAEETLHKNECIREREARWNGTVLFISDKKLCSLWKAFIKDLGHDPN